MRSNVLLTGATGFVGSNLLKELTRLNYKVRCITRNNDNANKIRNKNTKFVFGDISHKDSINGCMKGIDIVFHLAVMVNVGECLRNPVKAFEINTLGTLNILELIREETSKTGKDILLIYLSSDRVYGNCNKSLVNEGTCPCPIDPYSVSKLNSELLIKSYNTCYNNPSYSILRSANIYGYGQSAKFFIPSVISQIVRGKKYIKVGNLDFYRNFVYIEDLINALKLMLERRGKCKNQTFNVSESSIKMKKVLDIIKVMAAKHTNRSIDYSKDKRFIRPSAIEFRKFRLDCSKIKKIGWAPKTKFNEGLRKTFQSFLKNDG